MKYDNKKLKQRKLGTGITILFSENKESNKTYNIFKKVEEANKNEWSFRDYFLI